MAKNEITFQINVEPTKVTMLWAKAVLEMWLNASFGRGASVSTRYDDDGNSSQYITVFDATTGQEWGEAT